MSNQAPQEIERKFLVNTTPDLSRYVGSPIRQGYVALDSNGTEVRVRDNNGVYTQTVKTAGALVRDEYEIELSQDQFAMLWATTEGRRVEKTRYAIPDGEHIFELDIFAGKLSSLVVVEVEFTDINMAERFDPPNWFGADVTADAQYKNKNLALS